MVDAREREWPVSWEANRRDQLRTALQATPEQRLLWLEEAIRLAFESGALEKRRNQGSPDFWG